jgi:aminopeptidase N
MTLESAVPGENLTRIEANLRSDLLEVQSYEVALDLTTSDKTFRSSTTVKFTANSVGSSTFIDAITAEVHSVVLNGENLDVSSVSDGTRIQLENLQAENELTVISDAFYMNTGEGLHRFVDPADDEVYLYSQFEVPDSRRVFAVFEQPSLKATFQFTITAPALWKVVSNQATPTPTLIEDGKAIWVFEPTPRISSYITALIAGPYSEVRSELTSSDGRIIPLGVFARASMTEFLDADYIFDKTREGFEFFEKAFDFPYPFDKYDQLFVPEFNAGAMENAGAVTFTETYVFRSKVTDAIRERRVITILHELAHMWFGDLVTMQWWNDLWLNESFAEYASHLAVAEATEWKNTWSTFASLEKSWAFRQDQLPSTHPIVAEINDLEDVQVNFDGITYAKGAAVLKQLVAWVGQDKFLAGVSEYFKKHAFKNTQLKDLLVELEKTSGRELKSWSKLWLETAGVNTLKPEMSVSENGTITHFVIEQTAIASQPTIRPHRMAIGFYDLDGGKLKRTNQIELDVDGARTHVSQLVGLKQPALILLNDGDLAYAKIRLDQASWSTALEHLSDIEDPLARTIVWGAAVDASRDAEADPADFVRLVLAHISTETESTTMMTLLRQLVTTGNLYVNANDRRAALADIAEGLLKLARGAKAGSDAQLQFTKFFALFARSESQLGALKALLTGEEKLSGLTIDADLKWELLTGLVVAGAAGEAEIAELVAIDKTANGEKAAAGARAAIPTADNKAATWRLLTETKELSNAHVQAASMAFNRVIDTELLRPYVQKYFDSALAIWELHTFKIAEYLLVNLFPIQLADEATAEAARRAIAEPKFKAIPALHRILVENLDNLERALRCQSQSN